jgi:phosphatidylinositol alpha-1,6-mannosyltransferase
LNALPRCSWGFGVRRPIAIRTLLLVVEQRFVRTPDGQVWTAGHYPYSFLGRYLTRFQRVRVLARLLEADTPPAKAKVSSGPGVEHAGIPDYQGLSGLVRCAIPSSLGVLSSFSGTSAVLVRSPSTFGAAVLIGAKLTRRPIAVEVIGDPQDVFARGVFNHPLRAIIRYLTTGVQRVACRHANAVCYVSRILSQRYPSRAPSIICSDCELPPEAFVAEARSNFTAGKLRIVMVATFAQRYKGHDVLVEAISIVLREFPGLQLQVDFVGDGALRDAVQRHARDRGIASMTTFHGFVADDCHMRKLLDGADLMVLPSRTEGLPRVIIEAFARALPCIGTDVGGVPELLDGSCIFKRDDISTLARLIARLAQAPKALAVQSERNLRFSRTFAQDPQRARFGAFLDSALGA